MASDCFPALVIAIAVDFDTECQAPHLTPLGFMGPHYWAHLQQKQGEGSRLHSWQDVAHVAYSGIPLCTAGALLCPGLCELSLTLSASQKTAVS